MADPPSTVDGASQAPKAPQPPQPPQAPQATQSAPSELPKPPPRQNPAFRMLGMPNFRFRLPSRNWLIFLSVTGSFASAVYYDRRQKKAAQKKWCDAVSHFAEMPLDPKQMPRRLTVFLTAPPGDGIRPSRVYFKEYIKPILVAAAMDYDVVEGRKEGDLRYETAEHVRRKRMKLGEPGAADEDFESSDFRLSALREAVGIREEIGVKGDLVIGRHAWKEYVRGLHEGWLGPLTDPKLPTLGTSSDSEVSEGQPEVSDSTPIPSPETSDSDLKDELKADSPEEPEFSSEEEKKAPYPPPSFIATSAYPTASPSSKLPSEFEPSSAVPHRHILGFLKTPIRIYRFLNQRTLADSVGRQTAAIVFGLHRPYHQHQSYAPSSLSDSLNPTQDASPSNPNDAQHLESQHHDMDGWEQQYLLWDEEVEWHKSARKDLKDEVARERVWRNEVVVDPRIAERMRVFELGFEDEERARRIGTGEEKVGVED